MFVPVDMVFVRVTLVLGRVDCESLRLDLVPIRVDCVLVRVALVFVPVALVFGSMGAAVSLPSPGMKMALHFVFSYATSHQQRSDLLYRAAVNLKKPV
jgi:hypothetical protein